MLTRIDHIDLKVPDLDGFVAFLKQIGFGEVRRTNPERAQIEFALPGAKQVVLEVSQSDKVQSVTVAHIALAAEDVHEDVAALQAAGIEFTTEPRQVESGRLVCNFNDAWGMKWQLTNDLQ